jgi:protein O-GlcNAc transferase
MKKIIAFSLWGNDPIYCGGAIENKELAKKHYPGWVCRYYIGKSTNGDVVEKLKDDNTEIVIMNSDGDWTGMFWRFECASDPTVDVMLSRDTDSRLNSRESLAVSQWLKSNKDFHIMRDHPYHNTEILGGMWGVRNGLLSNIKKDIEEYSKGNFWQVDQNFLKEIIYPRIKDDCFVHDEFFEKKPFPTKRKNKYFVGQAFNEKNIPLHPEHMLKL